MDDHRWMFLIWALIALMLLATVTLAVYQP